MSRPIPIPRFISATTALMLALLFARAPAPARAAEKDPRAMAVAERAMAAMGGRAAYEAARLLRFDFQVERGGEVVARFAHWWDRWSGDYRLEGKDGEGRPFRVLFNIQSREGRAWVDGEEVAGEERARLLERAYGRFINDSYWFLMPFKWLDPGVRLDYEGEREIDGRGYEVVLLSFDDGTGLTSNDRYWGYVSTDSGRMERWAYLLQQQDGSPADLAGAEPTAWAWEGWRDAGAGLRLSTVKHRLGGDPVTISFPVLEARAGLTDAEVAAELQPAP